MKFKRLTIRNYRGVGESTVEFAERGVTLVQGPNEIGKTSLAESIHILFNFKPTTTDKKVREIVPVHRDAAPEIELEAESGGYHFVYGKKFHPRGGAATLDVKKPEAKNYTADAAHNQANQILRETLDKELWDALIVRQGDMIEVPDLSGKAGLMSALDSVAAEGAPDARSENLFERVRAEYHRYFTKNDREGDELARTAADAAKAGETAEALEAELRDLESKTIRVAELRKRLIALRLQLSAKERELLDKKGEAARIAAVGQKLEAEKLAHQNAEAKRLSAGYEKERRDSLLRTIGEARKSFEAFAAAAAEVAPNIETLRHRFAGQDERVAAAEQTLKQCEAALARARADYDCLARQAELAPLREKAARLQGAFAAIAEAEAVLAGNAVTRQTLDALATADRDIAALAARLRAEAPKVRVRGLGDFTIEVDGKSETGGAGFSRTHQVVDALRIAVPDRVELTVEPGEGSEGLAQKLHDAETRRAALLADAGVADPASAYDAFEKRRQAENTIRDLRAAVKTDLGAAASLDGLLSQLHAAESRIADHMNRREQETPLPDSLDSALALRDRAEAEAEQARSAREIAKAERAALQKELDSLENKQRDARAKGDLEKARLEQLEAELAAARSQAADDALENALEDANRETAAAAARVADLEKELAFLQPDRNRKMLDLVEKSLCSLRDQIGDADKQLAKLTTELGLRGEEGLFEKAEQARLESNRLADRLALLRSRAAAAAMLYRAMAAARDRARRTYLEPLKRKIEELGGWIFNPTFRVGMDERTLGIATRTLDGVTVPFDSLSGGTREQLSLIFRAACSILVSSHKGMPLILDDALGYTDTARLELMGAVLSKAAEQCQIIIFTCVPERYAAIGDAKIVQL